MSWIKRQLEKFKNKAPSKPKPPAAKQTVTKKPPTTATKSTKQTPVNNLQKAQSQALKVDKELNNKGITVAKGKDVTKIDPPTDTPATAKSSSGWKPSNNLPPRSRGKSKGKGMSR